MPSEPAISVAASRSLEPVDVAAAAPRTSETNPVRIVVFNDHPVFRSTLSWKLDEETGIRVIADAASLHETLSLVSGLAEGSVDAVIADLRVGDGNSEGVQSVRTLVDRLQKIPVLVWSDLYSSSYAGRMSEAGATAMAQKSACIDHLVRAIHGAVASNGSTQPQSARVNGSAA